MTCKGYTFSYYVSGHGFGHATRVNQIITELLKSTTTTTTTTSSGVTTTSTSSIHTIYIVSDAPEFIFQDVIALGAIYRNAKVDAGVVQPVAYYVDRKKTIEGCKQFLSRREEIIKFEVSWLAQVGVDCVLADAPFLPCAAASAYGIPAILITNFTFDEVYRYLQEGDDFDKDVVACADAALRDYKKASLLLRLPGYIDIPSFEDEVLTMESNNKNTSITTPSTAQSNPSPTISDIDDSDVDIHDHFSLRHHEQRQQQQRQYNESQAANLAVRLAQKKRQEKDDDDERRSSLLEANMDDTTPTGVLSPISMRTAVSSPNPSLSSNSSRSSRDDHPSHGSPSFISTSSHLQSLTRKAIDVPLVVRMAVNTREDVLKSLGVDQETINTKKMALVSFGGQSLKEGWGNPLPEGWFGVICGLPADYELPAGFYRSPHGVYVPDLTEAADVVVGKLGYGTCSECIGHNTPLIYVPRPQFVEEHGLIKMMNNHGIAVEMTSEEFENGQWQRAILKADSLVEQEAQSQRLFIESCRVNSHDDDNVTYNNIDTDNLYTETPIQSTLSDFGHHNQQPRRKNRRSLSVTSLSEFQPKGAKMARLIEQDSDGEDVVEVDNVTMPRRMSTTIADISPRLSLSPCHSSDSNEGIISGSSNKEEMPLGWFKRRIPNNGGEVCARLIQEYMAQL
ncbi:hypothetical protein BGZ46_006926 [Entomortierella lignicola]|nr:hypothetical protein BGZ46_006926 [Entomortierella lignicola]